MKNTFTPRSALPLPEFTRYGVANEIAQFQSLPGARERFVSAAVPQPRLPRGAATHQFDATEREIAFARTLSGKISPTMTHAMGPQVEAKDAM